MKKDTLIKLGFMFITINIFFAFMWINKNTDYINIETHHVSVTDMQNTVDEIKKNIIKE
jgi:hypothetical protein